MKSYQTFKYIIRFQEYSCRIFPYVAWECIRVAEKREINTESVRECGKVRRKKGSILIVFSVCGVSVNTGNAYLCREYTISCKYNKPFQ